MSRLKPKKITEWRTVKTVDELKQALNIVRGPGFGQVGHHIGYRVDESVIRDASNIEEKLLVEHAASHNYSRMDASALSGYYQSGVRIKSGKWNAQTGEMEYPDTSVHGRSSVSLPDVPRFGIWELLFCTLFLVWVPLQFWIEYRTGYEAAMWWLCGPLPVFMVLFGIARLVRELRDR